jgi:Tol biopolymer transport system component
VFISDVGGEESLRVETDAQGPGQVLAAHGPNVVLGNPHWSPDGGTVVFSSNRGCFGHKIFLLNATSKEERRLSPATSGACEPRFSPDGTRVVYVRRQHLTRDHSAIVEHDLRTGEEHLLVEWPALNYDPTYSSDGKETAFVSDRAGGGVQAIYRLRLADGQSWRVTTKYPARHPDYRPR